MPQDVTVNMTRLGTTVSPGALPMPQDVTVNMTRLGTTVTPGPIPEEEQTVVVDIIKTELTRVVPRSFSGGGTNPFDVTDVETNIGGGGGVTCSPNSAGNAGTPAIAINFDGSTCSVSTNTAIFDILVSSFNATTVSLTTGGNCSGISPTTLGSGSQTFTVTCGGKTFTFKVTVSILAGGAGVAIKVDSIT